MKITPSLSGKFSLRKKNFPNHVLAMLGVSLAYLGMQFLLQGSWLSNPGMWAENGTNYFRVSSDGVSFSDFFVTDSGYLPLILRLISSGFAVVGVPIEWIPFFQQATGLLLALLPVIFFIHPVFRTVLSSDFGRVLLSTLVLLFQSAWGMALFLNSTYSFVFFLFALAALFIQLCKRTEVTMFGLTRYVWWLAPLAIFSKPAALAVIPLFLYSGWKGKGQVRTISFLAVIMGSVQLSFLAYSRFFLGVFDRGASFSALYFVRDSLGYLFGMTTRLTLGPWLSEALPSWVGILLGMIIVSFLLIVVSRTKNNQLKTLLISGLILSFSAICMNGLTIWAHWNPTHWSYLSVPIHPHSLAPYLGLLISAFSTGSLIFQKFTSSIREKKYRAFAAFVIALLWVALSGWGLSLLGLAKQPPWPTTNNSQWPGGGEGVLDSATQAPQCALLDPWGWVLGTECESAAFTDPWGGDLLIARYYEWAEEDFQGLPEDRELFGVAIGFEPDSYQSARWQINAFDADGKSIGSGAYSGPVSSRKGTLLLRFQEPVSIDRLSKIQLSYEGFSVIGRQDSDGNQLAIAFFVLSLENGTENY